MKTDKIKNDITVILPVHELDDTTKALFEVAVKSIANQKTRPDAVIIVTPKGSDAEKYLNAFDYEGIKDITTVLPNPEKTDFSSQVNYAVENVKTGWFSILEFDDQYASTWFQNVMTYREAYDDVKMFLPIIIDVDYNGAFIGLTNSAVWAKTFSDEQGFLDNNALLNNSPNFNFDGMVMEVATYKELGGIKASMKLTFIYEFLLRMTFKDVKIMTIPKWGYKHVNQREGSLFNNYRKELNPIEANWWMSQAKKEYYFPHDREITYEAETA